MQTEHAKGLTWYFANLAVCAAYSSPRLFDSFSRYFVPSMYDVKISSIAFSSIIPIGKATPMPRPSPPRESRTSKDVLSVVRDAGAAERSYCLRSCTSFDI